MSTLEKLFKLHENRTALQTEFVARLTTFVTMAYIIIVNPTILSSTGMDFGAVMVATCLSAAIGTLIMGLWANYPFALEPGMGLKAFFCTNCSNRHEYKLAGSPYSSPYR